MTNQSIKIIVIQIVLLSIQYALLFGCSYTLKNRSNYELTGSTKMYIKAKKSVSYFLWIPLILLLPVLIYNYSHKMYVVHLESIMFCILAITAVFITFPTAFIRGVSVEHGAEEKLISNNAGMVLYGAPSIHLAYGVIGILSLIVCPGMNIALKIVLMFIIARIIVASYWTKQHVATDFAMGIPVAIISFVFAWMLSKQYDPDRVLSLLGL